MFLQNEFGVDGLWNNEFVDEVVGSPLSDANEIIEWLKLNRPCEEMEIDGLKRMIINFKMNGLVAIRVAPPTVGIAWYKGDEWIRMYERIRDHTNPLPPYPQFLAEQKNRLKNRFNFVGSNGDFLQVFDFNGAPEEIRTPDP